MQEVIWRGYFKGWLERRPQVWTNYVSGLETDLAALDRDRRQRRDVDRAVNGETGLGCFDAWATELVDTGYLHNHARMWFASIWTFTLGLPWRLGADFFYRHLLDGDAAPRAKNRSPASALRSSHAESLRRSSVPAQILGPRQRPRWHPPKADRATA